LLGPLAVHPDHRNRGIGTALMRRAIARARLAGHGAILLVGDAAYYRRFGFSVALTGGLSMPGRYDRDRLLALALKSGALAAAHGLIGAMGGAASKRDLNKTVIAAECGKRRAIVKRAA
jgi:predicted N-acetyltransferase YhbS